MPLLPPPFRSLLPHRYRHRRSHRRRLTLMLTILFTFLTLLTPLYLIYKPPSFLIAYLCHKYPDVLWHIPADLLPRDAKKTVVLTIDDAPSEYTEEILGVLKEHNVTATFFVIGSQVPGRENILKKIVEQGHELGNHAMHDEASRDLTDDELRAQILTVENLIRTAYSSARSNSNSPSPSSSSSSNKSADDANHILIPTSSQPQPPHYFRPGSGFFHTRMRALIHSMNYNIILGSIYPHDPQIPYWRINAKHVLSMLRPGGVIIVHDRRSWTVPMLKKVLTVAVGERGWRVRSLGEVLRVAGLRLSGEEGEKEEEKEEEREGRKEEEDNEEQKEE